MTWRYVTMPSHRRYCSYGHPSHVCYEQYALEVPLVHVISLRIAFFLFMKMMQNSGRVVMMKTKLGKGNPVWVDDKEEKVSINIAKVNRLRKLRKEEDEIVISGSAYVSRLRGHHVKLNLGTEWAQLDSQSRNYSSDDEDSDIGNAAVLASGYKDVKGVDDILRTNEDLVVKSSVKLLPGLLEYSRLVDANADDLSNAPINSVQFHRNAQLLLTAGVPVLSDKMTMLFYGEKGMTEK
ncbi:hypothetical protein HYC85_023042 [Camellia sinensis]|uniref:Uncharacterized protein n=1 Tax=Camellia sinensis TaxID=4442 RepID=A0A7J7GDE4_CAMSI|nr:hypothetical protein HYC85_023042 [Camellia sinensis]